MKNRWNSLAMGVAALVALSQAWEARLMAQQRPAPNLDDMFISEDTDAFDPGLPIGEQFPPIRALYRGEEVSSIDRFMGEKGAIFIANRSADW